MTDDLDHLLRGFSRHRTRRDILRYLAAAGAGMATLQPMARALAQASAQEVRSLTVLIQGGPVGDALRDIAAPLFTKGHPGTQVDLEVSSNTVTYPKMLATRDAPILAGGMFNELFTALGVHDKLWAKLDLGNMPNASKVPVGLHPDNGLTMIFQQTPFGIMYNPDRVEKPTSWTDLYKPEYKGRVSMWTTNMDAYAMAGVAAGKGLSVDAGIQAWQPHRANIGAWVTSPVAEEDLVAKGEMWLAPHWGAWAEQARVLGKHVAFAIPKEGATLWSNHACSVVNLRANSNLLIQAYLDTWFDEDIQRQWLMKSFISPVLSSITIPDSMKSNPAVVTPEQAQTLYRIPARELAAEFKRYTATITRQLRT